VSSDRYTWLDQLGSPCTQCYRCTSAGRLCRCSNVHSVQLQIHTRPRLYVYDNHTHTHTHITAGVNAVNTESLWLMPISCHFRDCKALLVTSLTHVSGAITSVQTFTFSPFTLSFAETNVSDLVLTETKPV